MKYLVVPRNKFQQISVENPFPVTKNVTAKSSSEYVNAIKNPAKIPGVIYGRITFVNTSQLLAPRSRAASIKDGLISIKFGRTIKTTIGTLKAICESNTEVKPKLNSSHRK